ncbi:putative electron transfer flavoprotein subunit [Puttea exsequens]|nr:putative electron transfer flavoprotein subunit [Puttea exsequens]
MKKSVIKRRKRVVPATNEQDPNASQLSTFPVSPSAAGERLHSPEHPGRHRYSMDATSPLDLRPIPGHLESPEVRNRQRVDSGMDPNNPANLALRQHERQVEHHQHYDPFPIAVDFSGYKLDQRTERRASSHQQPHLPSLSSIHDQSLHPSDGTPVTRLSPIPNNTSRKRSYDTTERDHPSPQNSSIKRLSSISSLLNHSQERGNGEMPIDPTLQTIHRHSLPESQPHRYHLPPPPAPDGRPRQSTSSDPGGWELREKKARLKREADEMRELLKAKERELEELGDG